LLVAVAVSMVALAPSQRDAAGAMDSAATTWTISAEGAAMPN